MGCPEWGWGGLGRAWAETHGPTLRLKGSQMGLGTRRTQRESTLGAASQERPRADSQVSHQVSHQVGH